jgi:hypothetical protein
MLMNIMDWLVVLAALAVISSAHVPALIVAMLAVVIIILLRLVRGEKLV